MNKITETISNPFKKQSVRASAQEEIAKIYLKVSDKNKIKSQKRRSKLPWIIAAAAIFLALLTLLFKSKIDISVKILGEMPSVEKSASDKFANAREKGLYLVNGSEANKYFIKDTDFAGDARAFSKIVDGEIMLCNSKGSGWANYKIDLREPLDLGKLDIRYSARGERGEEFLMMAVTDTDNRTYRVEKDMSSKMTKDYQTVTVNLKPFKNTIDIANIKTIKFEFGTLTAGNSPMATVYLKDICVIKTRRMEL